MVATTDQKVLILQFVDEGLHSEAIVRHLTRLQIESLDVVDEDGCFGEPKDDCGQLDVLLLLEVLRSGHGPFKVDLREEVGSKHRVAWLGLVGEAWREDGGQNGVDAWILRVDHFWNTEQTNNIVLEPAIDGVVRVKVLRLAVPLNILVGFELPQDFIVETHASLPVFALITGSGKIVASLCYLLSACILLVLPFTNLV